MPREMRIRQTDLSDPALWSFLLQNKANPNSQRADLAEETSRVFVAERAGDMLGCAALRSDGDIGRVVMLLIAPKAAETPAAHFLLDELETCARVNRLSMLTFSAGRQNTLTDLAREHGYTPTENEAKARDTFTKRLRGQAAR